MPQSALFGRIGSRVTAALAAAAFEGLPLEAQTVSSRQDVPHITVLGISTVRSSSDWPGVSLSVDRDAYVTVFAVTRGRVDFPLQVLSPTRPGDDGRLRAGKEVPVRQLGRRELLHLVNEGAAPVVVAFASLEKPDLSRFAIGKRWGPDLQIDSAAVDPRDMVDLLGMLVFGRNGAYDVMVSPVGDLVPQRRTADPFTFFDECRAFANQRTNGSGRDIGFYRPWNDIEPLERGIVNPVSYKPLTFSWTLGVPLLVPSTSRQDNIPSIQLRGGACTGVRVGGFSKPPTSAPAPEVLPPTRPSGGSADSTRFTAPIGGTPAADGEGPVLRPPPKSPR